MQRTNIKNTKGKTTNSKTKQNKQTKQIAHEGIPIKITVDVTKETHLAGRDWQDIFKVIPSQHDGTSDSPAASLEKAEVLA